MRQVWIGVDPGSVSGAIAAYSPGEDPKTIQLCETPQDINSWLVEIMAGYSVVSAVLERVNAMPKQGVSSSFKFGSSFGFCHGLLVAHQIRFSVVRPQVWQKAMNCLTRGDKNITKETAQRIWPKMKITHSTADAILLAMFARAYQSESWKGESDVESDKT